MRIVLTDKDLDNSVFPSDVQVIKITYNITFLEIF